MDEVRDEDPAAVRGASLRTGGAAGRGHRRRRQPERRHPVHRSTGPDLDKLERYSQRAWPRRREAMPGVVDVDTSLNVGKPELSVHLDRPKAADLGVQIARRRRSAAAAGRRRPGDDLQRRRRAVRSAPARRGRTTAARRTAIGAADRAVVAARQRAARQRRRRSRRATAPSEINRLNRQRQVTVYRQPAAGRVADAGAWTRCTTAADALEHRARLPRAVRRPVARARPRGAELPARRSCCRSSSCT